MKFIRPILIFFCVFFASNRMLLARQAFGSAGGERVSYVKPYRQVLNKFSFTGTVGYGLAVYTEQLKNLYFLQNNTGQYVIPITQEGLGTKVAGYTNWFNAPALGDTITRTNYFDLPYNKLSNPVLNDTLKAKEFLLATDTSTLKFRSVGHSIPLTLSVHYNYDRFRFGGGATLERQYFTHFNAVNYKEQVRPYAPSVDPVFFQRYFAMMGYRFLDLWDFSFAGELQLGIFKGGGKVYDYTYIKRGAFANLGLSMEKNLSEYFRVILKPSFDYHTFSTSLPGSNYALPQKQTTFFIQVGVSINIPEIPRCPLSICHIQLKHLHGNEEFRGQPITKHQNPKMGQNHRKLFRYKWRNRNKIEPY